VRVSRPVPFADENRWEVGCIACHRVNMTRVRKTVLEAIRIDGAVYRIACVLPKSGDGFGVIPVPISLRFKTHRTVLGYISNLHGIWRVGLPPQYDKDNEHGGKNKNPSGFHGAISRLTTKAEPRRQPCQPRRRTHCANRRWLRRIVRHRAFQ
jgi:hypothetical protein